MKFLLLATAFATTTAAAQPRAQSAEECLAFAEFALVASTLAKHGIAREKAETVLPDIYTLDADHVKTLARAILDAAYRPEPMEPRQFATVLGNACMRSGGSMEGILGTRL